MLEELLEKAIAKEQAPIVPCCGLIAFNNSSITLIKGRMCLWYNDLEGSTHIVFIDA